MKYLSEFQDCSLAQSLITRIKNTAKRPYRVMEVCGGQTHSIVKLGLDQALSGTIEFIHGPGCPVCVTGENSIDHAIALAQMPNTILCTFGDMLRVPGTSTDLIHLRANGADIRVVYSPLDAVRIAQNYPEKQVLFFAVGFETTAPVCALSVLMAQSFKLTNYRVLSAHVLVPPALRYLLRDEETQIDAFLGPGHVCSVIGKEPFLPIVSEYQKPIAITGFELLDILQGIYSVVCMLEHGEPSVDVSYARVVKSIGNEASQSMVAKVYETVDRSWRGIGVIPQSGLAMRAEFCDYDAENLLPKEAIPKHVSSDCPAGLVLQGKLKPMDCQYFGKACHPEHPKGAPMVSTEGACAAYFQHRRLQLTR